MKRYRHTMTGALYVLAYSNARIESEGMDGKVQSVYILESTINDPEPMVWIRPTSEFEAWVPTNTGQKVPRFALTGSGHWPHPVAPETGEVGSDSRWRGQDRRKG